VLSELHWFHNGLLFLLFLLDIFFPDLSRNMEWLFLGDLEILGCRFDVSDVFVDVLDVLDVAALLLQ
jgi:hypothetical protein